MKICIIGGTNPATNPKFYQVAEDLGKLLVKEKFEKVWGGNAHGVLAQIAEKYNKSNVKSTLILPEVYKDDLEVMDVKSVKMAQNITDRTIQMYEDAEVIITMPGGIGTIYEFWTALELKRAEEYDFDIILLNYEGFYQYQLAHYGMIYKYGFTKIGAGGAPYRLDPKELFKVATTPEDVITILKEIRAEKKKAK